MAQAQTVDARKVKVWRGVAHGGGGGVYIVCALITRSFNQSKQSNTFVVPDCDDPTVVAPLRRVMISKDATIAGNGAYEPDKRASLQTAFEDDESLVWSFEIPDDTNGGYYTGDFFLTTFNITAEEGNLVQAEMAWEADGPISWVDYP